MNRLDTALQTLFPTVMVPRNEEIDPLATNGHRFLSAFDGLHIEARRDWVSLALPVAQSVVTMPYGQVKPYVDFKFGSEIRSLLHRFINESRLVLPNEHAAWFSFDTKDGKLHYDPVTLISVNGGHIQYNRPSLPAHRVLAVDCHSHGVHPAFFSTEDDEDALDDIKLEIVVGSLADAELSLVSRLSVLELRMDYSRYFSSVVA